MANGSGGRDRLSMEEYYRYPLETLSEATVLAKKVIRSLRVAEGLNMNEGAAKIGLSRKQLEDLESVAPSCKKDVTIDVMTRVAIEYCVDLNEFWDEDAVLYE